MKIAIHLSAHKAFDDRWVKYCEQNSIPYKLVNAYDNNIMNQLTDCAAFMWHHHHGDYKDVLFAKQLLFSLEQAGKKVFPDFNTCWHFDDKVGQKYLLEAIAAPLVPSYVFYTREEAEVWINSINFPKVFKLRGGAGSANVKLVNSRKEALRIIKRAFGKGFSQYDWKEHLKEAWRKYKTGNAVLRDVLRPFYYAVKTHPTLFAKYKGNEKGYVYFQDFIPNNQFDIRVIVINNKAFAIKRFVRENDFRASGSGIIKYEKQDLDDRCVKIAFDVNVKMKAQCIAYDFVFDKNNNPLIVEISYGFSPFAYDACSGYWDRNMNWHEGPFDPYGWMVETVIKNKQL
jgi:glutathione synthase/RimK-type ligase-like ATP-grasp enzyme